MDHRGMQRGTHELCPLSHLVPVEVLGCERAA
jgi:hypothetical protein